MEDYWFWRNFKFKTEAQAKNRIFKYLKNNFRNKPKQNTLNARAYYTKGKNYKKKYYLKIN